MNTDPLVTHLKAYHDLPFPAAVNHLCHAHDLDPLGEMELRRADLNIIIDAGLSDAGCEAGQAILSDARFDCYPLTTGFQVLVFYGFDGARMLTLPLAQRPPKGGYRKLHWLPTLVKLA
jgi:hypothetical protein